jgi:hypothetical protein
MRPADRALACTTSERLAPGMRTPPWGFVPFSEIRPANRLMPACLTGTVRSQGFPPSQRFVPRVSLWLYFKPLPLVGFLAFRAFSTDTSRNASRHPFALLSLRAICIGHDFVLYKTIRHRAARFPA